MLFRSKQWCSDATDLDPLGRSFAPLYITERDFDEVENEIRTMEKLVAVLGTKEPKGV